MSDGNGATGKKKRELTPREKETEAIANGALRLYGLRRAKRPFTNEPEVVLVNPVAFREVLGEIRPRILTQSASLPCPAGGVTIMPSDDGMDARAALATIGARPVVVGSYPDIMPMPERAIMELPLFAPNMPRLFGPGLPGDTPAVPRSIAHGPKVAWTSSMKAFPPFGGLKPWWPKDYADPHTWWFFSGVAVNNDQVMRNMPHLGMLVAVWLVTIHETSAGQGGNDPNWALKGLNLGATNASKADGDAYFVHEDSDPRLGKFQAHFTAFDQLYSDPATAWIAAAARVSSMLRRCHVAEAFSNADSLPTDDELEAVAAKMYGGRYYGGVHKLKDASGKIILEGGKPVPDGPANIKDYAGALQKANHLCVKTLQRVIGWQ
jgi:hypothetical protein